ncbi:MAG: hypothetical protein ACFFBW_15020 [Promethearchaeota archaeon]
MSEIKKKKSIGSPIGKKKVPKRPSKLKTISAITLLALGVVLMPTGFLLSDIIQGEIDKGVAEQVQVPHPHSSEYEEWESNDYEDAPELYKSFYFWDLTNPEEFLAGNTPNYVEVGPFVFRNYKYKYDVDFSDNKDEVSYKEYNYFVQVGGEDISKVNITNINPAYMGSVELAGGTEEELMKLVFPISLDLLVNIFEEDFPKRMAEEVYTYDGVLDLTADALWIQINDLLGESFADLAAVPLATILMTLTPFENMVALLEDSMPTVQEIIYEKWANDYFPDLEIDMSILFQIDPDNPPDGLEGIYYDVLNFLFDQIPDLGIALGSLMAPGFQEASNDLLNEMCSETGEGIDVDWYRCGISGTDPKDISLVDRRVVPGGTGLTFEQVQALWDKTNPNSLTGMDYELGQRLWFDAMEDPSKLDDIKAEFPFLNGKDDVIGYILEWVNDVCTTWGVNALEFQMKEYWNCFVYTTRTVEEWLFTANDTAVYYHSNYYQRNFDRAYIGFLPKFFGHCQNTLEAEANKAVAKYTIKTGRDDAKDVGETIERNGQDKMYIWAEPIEIEGTDGMQFGPDVTEEDTLKVFSRDLLRTVELEYDEPDEIYDIDLLRFELSEDLFEPNPTYLMDTQLINAAPVANLLLGVNAPVMISKPHFLGADISILKGVNGMNPNSDYHDTYIDVEPITGLTMNAKQRIQMNLDVSPSGVYLKDVNRTIIPIYWCEDSGEISEDLAETFKELVYGAIELKETVPLMGLAAGAALCIPGAALTTSQTIKRRKIKKAGLAKDDKLKQKGKITKRKVLEDKKAPNLKTSEVSESKSE